MITTIQKAQKVARTIHATAKDLLLNSFDQLRAALPFTGIHDRRHHPRLF